MVPLFDEGEEIEKIGPRVGLAPGGGPGSPPERVPLEDALEDAQRRAEEAEQRELAAARARGGPDLDECIRAIEERYEREYAQIKRWRKQVTRQAWEILRDRYRNEWPRRYHLLTIDLWFTGRLSDAVGVDSFLFQTVQRSGEKITISPRIGYESEPWPKRMKLRVGSYLEPTRFAASRAQIGRASGRERV